MNYLKVANNEVIDLMAKVYCKQGINYPIEEIEVSDEIFNAYLEDEEKVIYSEGEVILNPNYDEIVRRRERQRLDSLILTPSDVERALLKAKGMDFDDLKAFLKEQGYTDLQIKAVGIELRANNFYRGATMGEAPQQIRIVDAIGALLGYTSEDMDYLFENKKLPEEESESN